MGLKIKNFVIQAKIKEDVIQLVDSDENPSIKGQNISTSEKREIIDECLDKVKELLERGKTRI